MMGLARAAAAGDGAATGQLLRAVAPRLGRVVRAVLGAGHPDLDDAVQQSLIGLVQALPAFRGDCEPIGYATIIAVRTAVATRKRSRTDQSRREDGVDADLMAGSGASAGEEVASNHRKELLRSLLDDLPVEQAEALAMRVCLGWSIKEIATHSGAPLNTVRSRLRLAKEALKSRIEGDAELIEALGVGR
ncbi:MAG TPA: RNA polymerase sigma factor [Polyangiaceae bacterium]|jgi:RNA polymerase sigma-70 factor (ECF subfamily)|nr:RNA polymerase sigma factor [Polyangiaceae bacterium]